MPRHRLIAVPEKVVIQAVLGLFQLFEYSCVSPSFVSGLNKKKAVLNPFYVFACRVFCKMSDSPFQNNKGLKISKIVGNNKNNNQTYISDLAVCTIPVFRLPWIHNQLGPGSLLFHQGWWDHQWWREPCKLFYRQCFAWCPGEFSPNGSWADVSPLLLF